MDSYWDIADAVDDEDVVLYYQGTIDTEELTLSGRTLYMDTHNRAGFRVDGDVNIALIQQNNNRTTTSFETGVSALDAIVNDLNDRHDTHDKQHNYYVAAILERGVATSVIIVDESNRCDPYRPADYEDEGEGDLKLTSMGFTAGQITVAVTNESSTTLTNALGYELTVRNEKGNLVFQGPATSISGSIANGQSGTIGFTYAGSTPTSAGDYSVTLRAMDSTGKVLASGSATLGTN